MPVKTKARYKMNLTSCMFLHPPPTKPTGCHPQKSTDQRKEENLMKCEKPDSNVSLAVSADSCSNGVFKYANGTKEITLTEICKVITMIRDGVVDPEENGEVYVTPIGDDTEFLVQYNAKNRSYLVVLP